MTTPHKSLEGPEPTPAELDRLRGLRESIAAELPELVARNRLIREAREENSLSGSLRDAIHRSELSLEMIATKSGLTPVELDEFLTGERTLRSDVLDRITLVIGYQLPPTRARA